MLQLLLGLKISVQIVPLLENLQCMFEMNKQNEK